MARGAPHGKPRQAEARGEEAQEEQGQEGQPRSCRDHAAHGRHPAQLRLFTAIRPPAEAVAHLGAALGRGADARWHVTLVFLGEQESDEPFDLTSAAAKHAPFEVRLQDAARLGTAVGTQLGGDVEALQRLAHDVRRACRAAGAQLEHRRYRPHLTVGRGAMPAALYGYVGPSWRVTEVELVQSVLGRGATHTVLRRFPLQG